MNAYRPTRITSQLLALDLAAAGRLNARIAGATGHVEGLSVSDGRTTAYFGKHDEAVGIVLGREDELLDDDALAMLAATVKERDFQIWLEKVDSSGTIGIVMEDGEVKP